MQRPEVVAPIQNKVGALLSDPRIHRIVAGSGKPLRLRSIMDEGRVLLINPHAWLNQTLTRLVNRWPTSRIDELMPWNYAEPASAAVNV